MIEEKTVLLKDQYFNRARVAKVAECIAKAYPTIDKNAFTEDIVNGFPTRELKERMSWMRINIEKYLPNDYLTTLNILLKSLDFITDHGGFTFSAYTDYVMVNGCTKEYLAESLNAIGEFTKYVSGEFTIRKFLNNFPAETYEKMWEWSLSNDLDQRRLASEALRPKLPWSIAINIDYKKGALLLDNLYYDNERYVTRSVANHLNDISKIDPDFVIETLGRWLATKKQSQEEMDYIIAHSLRTLIKRGHLKTLEFLGYSNNPMVEVSTLRIAKKVLAFGEYLEFSFDVIAKKAERLIIDYKITYPMKNNKKSEKVFKIKKVELTQGEKITIVRKRRFKRNATKKHYSGVYKIEIQVNGKVYCEEKFNIMENTLI